MLLDENKAQSLLETVRWPSGPVCPYCFSGRFYERHVARGEVNPARLRRRKCASCRRSFTVTTRSVLSGTHIPLSKWIWSLGLIRDGSCSSALGLKGSLDLKSYSSALFLYRRIRWILAQPQFVSQRPRDSHEMLRLLFEVEPSPQMPRPGTHRQKSVRDEVAQETGAGRRRG